MCGIVAVLGRPSSCPPPGTGEVVAQIAQAEAELAGGGDVVARLAEAAEALDGAERVLRGSPGLALLLADRALADEVESRLSRLEAETARLERAADAGELSPDGSGQEALNAALVRLKDATWTLRRDRVGMARAVADLAGPRLAGAALDGYAAIQTALSAIDRLEVRGRDSAGILVLVSAHGVDLDAPEVRSRLEARADPLFTSGAVRSARGRLGFVYKAASEVGELGDNTRTLRRAIRDDDLLAEALSGGGALATVLGHTRWASMGVISEANAHPLDQGEGMGAEDGPFVAAAANGDVDNYVELRRQAHLRLPVELTTDSKVVPVLISRRRAQGATMLDAFRETVGSLQGSLAVAASAAEGPDLMLALRGSGQSLYVGLAEDAFVVASEPYGVVGEARRYVRMDGEAPADTSGRPGQLVLLDRRGAGTLRGLSRIAYDGAPMPVDEDEVRTAEITTRDVDRGPYAHFLLKEISEAPASLRKTLRGRVVGGARPAVDLGEDALPGDVRAGVRDGRIRKVVVIGQGTAAVAAEGVAAVIADALVRSEVTVVAMLATELSGFGLRDDMADTLLVAVSQSGTTTDTNRTVDLARGRGAAVVSIVNRRGSDLVERSHGVLYTSDGRDLEMSVASTKAFYAQIAAGAVLAAALGEASGRARGGDRATPELLAGLRQLPAAMERVLSQREAVAEAAGRYAPSRRSWAVVGSGRNRIAAAEVRIKLSELCYKSIACDAIEDKKHIDLSSEPLVLVCATGLTAANADDVAKEVAIYRAHKAAPVVVASEGDGRFADALSVIAVPRVHPSLDFVLSAMVGHLFGYEAALAIDAQAGVLRRLRAAVEAAISNGADHDLLARLAAGVAPPAGAFLEELRRGSYDGHLDPSTAVRLASLLRYADGTLPLDLYQVDHGRVATPGVVVEDLVNALTLGIEELTRPIDAIKHQAKTVTVGITRSEEALFSSRLVEAVLAAGAGRDRLTYRSLRTLAALEPAVAEVAGHTHYRVEGSLDGAATIHVERKGGVAAGLASRTESDPTLRGTKHRAASQRLVTVARGHDGRVVIIVPEVKDDQVCGLTLLHVRFRERLDAPTVRTVLEGYQSRLEALADSVTETEPSFDDDVLAEVDVVDLLTVPVHVLAQHWRAGPP